MDSKADEKEETFLVECAWCGSKIRDGKHEDTSGACLQCFYQILSNYLIAQQLSPYGEFVSDR
jgi:hypothetical protein